MPVEVRKPGTGQNDTHTDGTGIGVSDGHLHVYRGTAVLAIYAPECWRNAQVTKGS